MNIDSDEGGKLYVLGLASDCVPPLGAKSFLRITAHGRAEVLALQGWINQGFRKWCEKMQAENEKDAV